MEDILARLESLHPKRMDLSLGRIRRLLGALDNPERHLPPVVQVAGTNGKGSVVAYLAAIARAQGWTSDTYTSPHLVRFNERIGLAGKPVKDSVLISALRRAELANKGQAITFFEITTAAAFLIYAEAHKQKQRDLLILEVGLGGRLDATSVVPNLTLSVLTPIDLDHQAFLGNSLTAIAKEKAAIIRKSTAVVSAKQRPAAERVLQARAKTMVAPLLLGGSNWHIHPAHNKRNTARETGRESVCVAGSPFAQLEGLTLTPALVGTHQGENAALASVAAAWLGAEREAIAKGVRTAQWQARLQKLERGGLVRQLPKNWELWLDGGHNPSAARVLRDFINTTTEDTKTKDATEEESAWSFIVSLITGKSVRGFLDPLLTPALERAKKSGNPPPLVIAVPPPSDHQAIDPHTIAKTAETLGCEARTADSVEEALAEIIKHRPHRRGKVLICGSLYQAGSVLANIDAQD